VIKILLFIYLSVFPTVAFMQEPEDDISENMSDSATEIPEEDVEVAIGVDDVKRLDFAFSSKVQIGDPGKLQLIVVPKKQEITFRGIRPGATSVILRNSVGDIVKKYKVNVTSTGKSSTVQELRELIGDVEGITIGIKGGKIVIEGEIIVPDDYGRISAVLSKMDIKDIIPLYELSPQTQRVIAKKMQDELARNSIKDVSIRVVNKLFWVEGVVTSEGKKKQSFDIIKAYLPPKIKPLAEGSGEGRFSGGADSMVPDGVLDFVSVNAQAAPEAPTKQVKITSQFVELAKDYKKVFGFQWQPLMNTGGSIAFGKTSEGGVTTDESGTLSGTISNLFPKLMSAKEAGYARVIQSGMVLTHSGKKGYIQKNRSFSYSIGSGELQAPTSANINFTMDITPTVKEEEKIDIVSNITVTVPNGQTTQGAPDTTTNTVNTTITVKNKESAVIGGVVQNTANTGYDKNAPQGQLQGGADAPSPLFNLIRSKSYITQKSQFVMFVTPEVVESASVGSEEIRKKFRKRVR
jgi:pilus assembly protein CpaC